MGDLVPDGCEQRLLRQFCPLLEQNKDCHNLPLLPVRHSDGGRLPHLRQGLDHPFHLGRVDVFPGADDHLHLPADDIDESLFVPPSHIPGVKPSAPYRLRRLGGLVPITRKHARPLDDDLARLAGFYVALLLVHDPQQNVEHLFAHGTGLPD